MSKFVGWRSEDKLHECVLSTMWILGIKLRLVGLVVDPLSLLNHLIGSNFSFSITVGIYRGLIERRHHEVWVCVSRVIRL